MQQLQQPLQQCGSVVYLYKYFIKRKKYMWQEIISSKPVKKEIIKNVIKNILMVSLPIAVCALLSATTKTIDAVTLVRILKKIIGEEKATIQYGILNGKVDTLIMLPFSFNIAFATALVPTISASIAKKDLNTAKRRIKFSILVTTLIGIPCSVLMSTYSEQILNLLFPNATSGSEMLKYSAWSIIFVVLTQTINGALQGMGKLNIPLIAFGIGAIVKLILNLLLIPIVQVNGAIISTIVSHVFSFIICFISLKKSIDIKFETNKFVIKPCIATGIIYAVSHIFYKILQGYVSQNLLLILTLLISIFVYIISILFLKILSKEEIAMLPYGQKTYKKIQMIKP